MNNSKTVNKLALAAMTGLFTLGSASAFADDAEGGENKCSASGCNAKKEAHGCEGHNGCPDHNGCPGKSDSEHEDGAEGHDDDSDN